VHVDFSHIYYCGSSVACACVSSLWTCHTLLEQSSFQHGLVRQNARRHFASSQAVQAWFSAMPKSKAATQRRVSNAKASPAVSPDTTLADQHHAEASKRVRQDVFKKEKALNAVVQKCIRDNFAMFGEQEIHHVKIDGLSLHERLMRDKRWAQEKAVEAPKFGKVYFTNLRKMYECHGPDESALDIKDESLPISPQLFAAVDASRAAVPNRDKLIQFCQMAAKPPNQSEVVGLFLHGLELKPWLGGSHVAALLEIARYIRKFTLDELFKEEWRAFSQQVDKTLVQAYSTMKSKGFKASQFIETYRNECQLVVPVDSIDRLLKVTGSWAGHESDITLVVESSALGRKMFQYAADANLSHTIGKSIDDKLAAVIGKTGKVTVDMVAEVRAQVQAELEKKSAFAVLDKPRVVEISYNGVALRLKASSVWDELTLRLNTFLKQLGLNSKGTNRKQLLDPLLCEDDLLKEPRQSLGREVDEAVLRPFLSARRSANAQLAKTRQGNGEHVKDPGDTHVRQHIATLLLSGLV
jgi:hypothetical protein